MRKLSFLFLLGIIGCSKSPQGTQFLFALESPGTYSVQMRDDVGEFLVLDTLELTGNDAFYSPIRYDPHHFIPAY